VAKDEKKPSKSKPKKKKAEPTKVTIELPPIEYSESYQFQFADGVQLFVESMNQGRLIFLRRDPILEDLISRPGPGLRQAKLVVIGEVALPYNTMVELRDALLQILPILGDETGEE